MNTHMTHSFPADGDGISAEMGARVAFWLRSAYGSSRAKHVAREFNVSVRTAEDWIGGHCPTSKHLEAMAKRWGWRFIHFVYEGAVGCPAIDARITAIEAEIDALRTAQAARGRAGEPVPAGGGCSHRDGALGIGLSPKLLAVG